MNQNLPQSNFELPSLPDQANGVKADNSDSLPRTPESHTKQQAPQVPIPPSPASMPMAPVQNLGQAVPVGQSSSVTPIYADDNDLIEKEWVTKAKQIVLATKEDPHKQNQEISKFKADYLRKRYNKNIKLEEG